MTSASFGSATRHIDLKITTTTTTAIAAMIRMVRSPCMTPSHGGDDDRPWRVVLDHHDPGPGLDDVVGVGGVGDERLRATAHRNHHLPEDARLDRAGDPA